MPLIKVGLPFLNDSADFWHRKMTLKIRIELCLTLKIKRPRILVFTPSWSWGQPYSSLNSAKLSWKSEVTLKYMYDVRAGKTFCLTKGGSFSGKRGLPDFKYCIATTSSLLCQTTQHYDRKIKILSKNYEAFLLSKSANI